MKYSIVELDRIRDILVERLKKSEKITRDIFFGERNLSEGIEHYWDDPEYKLAEETTERCKAAIEKIDSLLINAVDDFIKQEIELK